MGASPAALAFACELFEGLGEITTRRMFGGYALYHRGEGFAMLMGDDRIYLKASGRFAEALAADGSREFSYTRKDGRVVKIAYWSLPDAALDDPEAACALARRALGQEADFS